MAARFPLSLMGAALMVLATAVPRAAQAEPYRMNDLGAGLELPPGWEPLPNSWSDFELKAKSPDNVHMRIWMTPFQVELSEEAQRMWTGMYADGLRREKFSDVVATDTGTKELAGRTVGYSDLEFKIEGGGRGVAHFAAIPTAGHTIHLRTLAASNRASKAESSLGVLLEALSIDKEPLETKTGRQEAPAGFALSLPEGWRKPLPNEREAVKEVAEKVGQELASDECIVGIKPPAVGDVDVIFACQAEKHLPPLDEHSFEGVEAEIHAAYFGRSETKVDPGEMVQMGDRVGVYYLPPVKEKAIRLAIVPYNGGQVAMWGFAGNLDDVGLNEAMRAILPTFEYTGPNDGKPIIGADKWAMYYLKYRPTSPVVLAPLGLGVLGLLGIVAVMRGRKKPEDLD